MDKELTRLHRLTDEEAELIQDYRLLSDQGREAISLTAKLTAKSMHRVGSTADNVVSIRPTTC